MMRPARPEQRCDEISGSKERPRGADPVFLRHRFQGSLGQMLRDYYADVLDQPVPDRLLQLIEQFREKEQEK